MSKFFLAALIAASSASALSEESLVKDAIVATLKEAISLGSESEVSGVQNCLNKCKNTFDNTQYAITSNSQDTNEYQACAIGCKVCDAAQTNNDPDGGICFKTCKDTDWLNMKDDKGNPMVIVKGVIEPDKACEMGCVIQTCQVVCTGGTTDMKVTAANKNDWWPAPNGCPNNAGATCGCSIKTGAVRPGGFYTQNSQYNYWNSGQIGQGGASECCSNALTVCSYAGNKKSSNYKNAVSQMQSHCASVPGIGSSVGAICTWSTQPGNCGSSP